MVNEHERMLKGNPDIVYPEAPGRSISFKCYKCPSIFDKKDALVTHSSLHGSGKRFKCHSCDYAVNSNDLLSKHLVKHNSMKRNTGAAEKAEGSEPPTRKKARSSVEPQYTPSLTRSFASPSLTRSFASPSGVIKCEDDRCPATFRSRTILLQHMANHRYRDQQPLQCPTCTFATRRRDQFQKHLSLHGITPEEEDDDGEAWLPTKRIKKLQCPKCPERLATQKEFVRHLNRHKSSEGDKYQCTKCSYSTMRSDSFNAHQEAHEHSQEQSEEEAETESSTVDLESTDGFSERSNSSPERQRKFECPKCPYLCKSRANNDMEKHLACHDKGHGRFKCSHCDYSAQSNALKEKHEKLHTNEDEKQFRTKTENPTSVSKMEEQTRNQIYKKYSMKKVPDSLPASITQEEFERYRKGNPAIKYEPYMKTVKGGVIREIQAFKCFSCPYQSPEYSVYASHVSRHGGTPRRFQCNICDFSHDDRKRLEKHKRIHESSLKFYPTANVSPKVVNTESAKSPLKTQAKPIVQRVMPQAQSNRTTAATHTTMSSLPVKSFAELYSVVAIDNEQAHTTNYLVHNIKVSNFMSISSFDLSPANILTFLGVGKSASISALLIGLGYDLLLDDPPQELCGIDAQDFIRRDSEESTIELVLSLHAAPALQREYGSHLRLIRTLQCGVPLAFTTFQIMSADSNDRFPKSLEIVGRDRVRRIQKEIGLTPEFSRLLLLDETNLCHFLDDIDLWYNLYRLTYDSRKCKIEARLHKLRLKVTRLHGEIEWRKEKVSFLESEISKGNNENQWKNKDQKELHDLNIELEQMEETQNELKTGVNSFLNELNKLPNVLTGRLKFRYLEFLHRQDYMGSILINEKDKSLAIWIVQDKQASTPTTFEDATLFWTATSLELKRIAVIGLFFALIDIAEAPIFFVDAASTRASEFTIPLTAFPLLTELIEKKCSQGHQFVTSLPDEDEAENDTGSVVEQ